MLTITPNVNNEVYKHYSTKQISIVEKGLSSDPQFNCYGDVSDLSPIIFSAALMEVISRGRGNNPIYGRVDDIDRETDHKVAKLVSLGRGSSVYYGNIDFLLYTNVDYKVAHLISLGEGSDSYYPSIKDIDYRLPYLEVLKIAKIRIH